MPKPLRLPDDDRPRKKKPVPQKEGLPLGPLIGAGVGGVVLLGVVAVVWWAVGRDGPPPPKPAPAPAVTPATEAKTAPTTPKLATADELYQWLVGGEWVRTGENPVLGGQQTVRLTFLADKTLVVKQTVPDILGGLGGGDDKPRELADSLTVSVELIPDSRVLKFRSADNSPLRLAAAFQRFRLRFETDGTITLTEPGNDGQFQATPYTRAKAP